MKLIFKSAKQQITVPEFALQTGFDVIEIYAMIDEKKIKSTKNKSKRTMILL